MLDGLGVRSLPARAGCCRAGREGINNRIVRVHSMSLCCVSLKCIFFWPKHSLPWRCTFCSKRFLTLALRCQGNADQRLTGHQGRQVVNPKSFGARRPQRNHHVARLSTGFPHPHTNVWAQL